MTDFLNEARSLFSYTQTLRRDFHLHPELGFREIRTSGIVAKELEALGLEVTKGVGKTGVVGLLEGAKPGPTLLLRFDMDALPIHEETGAEYASQNAGVMHACGHDGHTAIGLTVAKLLNQHKDKLAGTIKFCFQPSEEGNNGEEVGGAEMMMRDGVLDGPKVDMTLSLHLWNEKPLGWVNVAKGPVMAGAEEFKIKVIGKGGHGAIPDLAVDPVVCAAQIVSASQSIVSRNVGPLETAVISFTVINGGTAFNVIPQEVMMQGTIRTFDPQVRMKVLQRFDDVVRGVASAMGCQVELNVKQLTPALINAERVAASVQATAQRLLPNLHHDLSPYLTMGAEDMAYMQAKVDGCYFFIGSNNHERHLDYGHHHPKFDFDEQALITGSALMAAAAADILK
ncbi:MAG TPA: amidohydrolase [Anaerolineales bacterium]|nr:amidohydrolase [Anaerolineales bacterium]HMX73027.1 amidohydrolase [Anaerolineales bacterium]HND90604.1 amidohydrolase [Anaerolineales bacterium]HNE66966.1 amidohydrolase [Anaerolineales bacterium]HNF33180.1 amidohydrolase [Anaerolineales bacterium]